MTEDGGADDGAGAGARARARAAGGPPLCIPRPRFQKITPLQQDPKQLSTLRSKRNSK